MVEGAPLLREYTGNGIEGSNPFVSATLPFLMIYMGRLGRPFLLFYLGLWRISFVLDLFRFGLYDFIEWYELWYEND